MSASRERKNRQAQSGAPMTEKAKQEAKQAKTLKIQTTIFVVVCVLMVLVLVACAVVNTGIVERTATALTVGEHKISAAEMNYYYVSEAYNYYSTNYQFLSYFISSSAPLDKQVYNSETGETWADQFMAMAADSAKNIYALYDAAMAAGYELSEADQAAIDSAVASLDTYASLKGVSSANAYLRDTYGRGCNVKNYRNFVTVQQIASSYATEYHDGITYTEEDLANCEAEDPTSYNTYDYRYYYIAVQDFYDSDEPTDEEKAAAQDAAKAAAEEMAAGSKGDEQAFILKAVDLQKQKKTDSTEETEDYNADTATLYTDTMRDDVNTDIVDWITDSSRKAGDCEALESRGTVDGVEDQLLGYYVPLFLGSDDNTGINTKDVRHILITDTSDEGKAKIEELQAKFEENPTEENFAALATENTEDTGSKYTGGLYEAVQPGQMVEAFNDWCFDESRKPGDYGIVQTEYGYHLIYMVGDNVSYRQSMIINDYKDNTYNAWFDGLVANYTTTYGFGKSWVHTGIYLSSNS